MKKMYLDIDGVLLGTIKGETALAHNAERFIRHAVENYDCYWLTTHCKGDANVPLKYLRPYVDDCTYELLKKIKATSFDIFKTEALSPNDEFLWIEDKLLRTEHDWLKENSKLSSWYWVNTYKDFYALDGLLTQMQSEH